MRKFILLFILFGFISSSMIGNPLIVKLKYKKEVFIKNRNYYVSKIIDNRTNKDKEVGRLGKGKRKTILLLKEEPEKYFFDFFSAVLPKKDNKMIPVILKINSINCESKVGIFTVKAIASIDLEIISTEGDQTLSQEKISFETDRPMLYGRTFGRLIEKILIESIYRLTFKK